ncbi:hypothetical protein Poli38472_004650 [Pythium oligandrum]|uniref:Uncharacterized protein n=1 Tax=Pythium oligandrum TaxID=41045 RepID=A0A8K1FEM4_PYTOL|nr:hypothetical protein Poli38472_004650 [Pythium oligandrum]|eukprot:TMW59581.1 hypothetical protein Poli38472_004650 [Pythium oligandrum]
MDPSCNQTHPDATDLPVSNVPKPTDDSVIQVRVKRVRLLLVTCVTVAFAASIVLSFRNGVPVYTFDANTKSLKETNKLIDDYNSYLANVASAFSRPISITIDIVTQVILLRFATALFCGG